MVYSWQVNFPDLSESKIWPILQKIAGEIPCYNLPDASVSRSRYRVPARTKSTLITSTFVIVGDEPVGVVWRHVVFNAEEIDLMTSILKKIRYLGRSESRCIIEVTANNECNCEPLPDNAPDNVQSVRVLMPRPGISFVDIHANAEHTELNAISVSTKIMQSRNYTDPPGGRYVRYDPPKNLLLNRTTNDARSADLHKITLVRYTVLCKSWLPITQALRVGDIARSACMSRYGQIRNNHTSCIFSGKDPMGRPLADHIHGSYLPTSEAHTGIIDHLTIVANGGFDRSELDVLFALNDLYGRGLPKIRLVFQGCGTFENFNTIPILQTSKRWMSTTPMILTRHTKYRGRGESKKMIDGPEEQIRNELLMRYEYDPIDVFVGNSHKPMHESSATPVDFYRWRSHGSTGWDKTPYQVRLEFKEPVSGPISLGYASHYGLGMFVPDKR